MTIAIIGGGIAGSSLMEALIAAKQPVQMLHNFDPMMGSMTPTALFHPFPGRSLKPHPLLARAVSTTTALLEHWHREHPDLLRFTQMHRPLLGRSGERLQRTFERHWQHCRDSWLTISGPQASAHPWIKADSISYCPAAAVDLGTLLPRLWSKWMATGQLININAHRLRQSNGSWWVHSEDEEDIGPFDQIVLAVGAKLRHWFPHLPVSEQGGDLVLFSNEMGTLSQQLPELVSINGVHVGPHHSGGLVVGSTRWSPDDPSPKAEAAAVLQRRAQEIMPGFPGCTAVRSWSGLRCNFSPNRLPSVGKIPTLQGVSLLGTLGSKGLLWGPLAAAELSNSLLFNREVEAVLSLGKMSGEHTAQGLWYSPNILS